MLRPVSGCHLASMDSDLSEVRQSKRGGTGIQIEEEECEYGIKGTKVQKAEAYSTETPQTTAEGAEAFKIACLRRYATAQLHNSF